MPACASLATRSVRSARIAAAVALPSRMIAVIAAQSAASVEEVPGTGEVQRDARRLGGRDHLLVTDRPAWLHDRPHPGVDQDLQPVREREVRVAGADRAAAASSPARATASRQESTRFTWPIPTPTVAPPCGQQDRVGLHRPAGPPGERQVGQRLRARRGSPAASVQVAGRRRARRRCRPSAPACRRRPAAELDRGPAARSARARAAAAGSSSLVRMSSAPSARSRARRSPR